MYENQDPNRPPDEIVSYCSRWYDTDGVLHRGDDLPAICWESGSRWWYVHGVQHRETGPAALLEGHFMYFFLNDELYSLNEWLDQLTCSDDEKILLKLKWG
jgi:hypothetical protein